MQRRAREAYDTQWLLHSLTGTVPSNSSPPESANSLRAILNGAVVAEKGILPMNSSLYDYLTSKNIVLPVMRRGKSRPIVFLLDLEGTVTSFAFTRGAMREAVMRHLASTVNAEYPHDNHMVGFIQAAANFSPELKAALAADEGHKYSVAEETDQVRQLFVDNVMRALRENSKLPYVQQIQSYTWLKSLEQSGTDEKTGVTHVFRDVDGFVRTMGTHGQSRTHVAIYSSANKESQVALFKRSCYGDLTPFISTYFDLNDIGSKLAPKSYSKIRRLLAERLDLGSADFQIIFITDATSEVSAAETSGAVDCSLLCLRPYNQWITFDTFLAVSAPHLCSLQQLVDSAEPVDFDALLGDAEQI